MANQLYMRRLKKELRIVEKEPPPHVTARPLPSCILKWYFVIKGPPDTPYATGIYMGKLLFPEEYPYKPPAVYMITPNGRFKSNMKLCLSMSDFHPETWNPLWSVSAVLTGLLSFMLGSEETVGSVMTSDKEKIRLAKMSHDFNQKDKIFRELFPDFLRTQEVTREEILTDTCRQSTSTPEQTREDDSQQESLVSLVGWTVLLLAICVGIWKFFSQLGVPPTTESPSS